MSNRHASLLMTIFVAAASSAKLAAQESAATAAATVTPYLVALSVANLDSSAAWYQTMLGFGVMRAPYQPVPRLRIAFLTRDDFRIELIQARNSRPRRLALPDTASEISLQGFVKLGFRVADIAAAADRFRQHRVPFVFGPAADSAFRERHFIVTDPDGNLVQLFEPFRP